MHFDPGGVHLWSAGTAGALIAALLGGRQLLPTFSRRFQRAARQFTQVVCRVVQLSALLGTKFSFPRAAMTLASPTEG